MALTKAEIEGLVSQLLDDPNNQQWSSANISLLLEMVYDQEWTDIIDADPWRNVTTEVITPTTPGIFAVSSLTGRFYMMMENGVVRDSVVYSYSDPRQIIVENNILISGDSSVWTMKNQTLWFFPLSITSTAEVTYNAIPPDWSGLADGSAPLFPDGHESVLIWGAVRQAYAKGEREQNTMSDTIYNTLKRKLMSSIRSNITGPITMYNDESPISWGSTS